MHPPGVLTSHIFGSVLRIFRLNSDETDILNDTLRFYHNFIKRGHKEDTIKPLFFSRQFWMPELLWTEVTINTKQLKKRKPSEQRGGCILIWNTKSSLAQNTHFSEWVLNPTGKKLFNELISGRSKAKIPIDAIIIANQRAKNLGDLFSIRYIEKKPGSPVSSYLWRSWGVLFCNYY